MGAVSGGVYDVRFTEHFEERLVERVPMARHRRRIRSEVRRRLNAALRVGVQPYGADLNVMVHISAEGLDEEYKVPCVPVLQGYWVAKTLMYEDDERAGADGEIVEVSVQ